jgi:hypothetical protein
VSSGIGRENREKCGEIAGKNSLGRFVSLEPAE